MHTVILPLVLITLSALAISYLWERKFVTMLPLVTLTIMLVLYSTYALNLLRVGRLLVLLTCTLLIVLAIYRMLQKREVVSFARASILTPSMLIYLLCIGLFAYLSYDKLVGIWDTLRLWGALPKALHAYGSLQFGESSSLFAFSQSYPPAVPLLQYFFVSFSPTFSEGALFFTRAWFGLVLLLPITRNLSWRNWHSFIPLTFLLLFIPYYLTTNDPDFAFYYESLYVDAPAGLLCGYLCWETVKNPYRDRLSTLSFSITIMVLILTKDFGILFGGLCLLGSAWHLRPLVRKQQWKALLGKLSIPAISLVLSYLSWQILMKLYNVSNYNTVTATIPSLSTLWRSFVYFASTVLTVDLSIVTLSIPYGTYLLLLLLLYAMMVYRNARSARNDLPFLVLRIIGYGGYFFAYVMMFRDDIAASTYPSIARYMVAMLLCEAYVFLMTWTRESSQEQRFLHRSFSSLSVGKKGIAVLLSIVLLWVSVVTIQDFWKYDGGVYRDAEQATALVTDSIETDSDTIADIWLVIGGDAWDNSLLHHRIYFDLIGTNARITTYILEANITQSGQCYTPDTFLQALVSGGYSYVLLLYGDDVLLDEFGILFPELIPYETDFLLYQVTTEQGVPTLSFVAAS